MHLRMNTEAMPPGRTVLQFELADSQRGDSCFWILAERGRAEVCIQHPGHEPDLRIGADMRLFVETWRGFRSLSHEIRAGRIRVEGPPELRRAFPSWMLLSALAHVPRKRAGRERGLSRRRGRPRGGALPSRL